MSLSKTRLDYGPEERERLNSSFASEVDTYSLKYRCCDCIHFSEPTSSCSLRYPNYMLMDAAVMAVWHDNQYVFCKDFELVL